MMEEGSGDTSCTTRWRVIQKVEGSVICFWGPSHVFMFFSADTGVNNFIYTIEGNVGNRAVVRKIKVHDELPDPYVYPRD